MRGISTDIQKKLLLSVGSHRGTRPLSPVEVGEAVQASVSAGTTMQEIAEFLHLEGTSVLTKFVRLVRLSPLVRHLVDWGKSDATIGFTAASEIARLDDPQGQFELAEAGLRYQLGSSEMKQVLQLHKRSGQSVAECVSEIMRLRPQVEQIHVLIGAVTSPKLREFLATCPQTDRDLRLKAAVTGSYPGLKRFGGRLGADRFTITGDKDVSAALTQGGKDFEAVLNNALAEALPQ